MSTPSSPFAAYPWPINNIRERPPVWSDVRASMVAFAELMPVPPASITDSRHGGRIVTTIDDVAAVGDDRSAGRRRCTFPAPPLLSVS